MAGEIFPPAAGRESEPAELARPCSAPICSIRSGKNVPEKALTISGTDRFIVVAAPADHTRMYELVLNWGYQEELSSTAACHVPKTFVQSTRPPHTFDDKAARPARWQPSSVQPPRTGWGRIANADALSSGCIARSEMAKERKSDPTNLLLAP